MIPPKDQSDTAKLIKFYKTCINKIAKEKGWLENLVDKEVKQAAGFPFDSCKDAKIDDMQNLIEWMFVYADQVGVEIDYPQDELDKKIELNFNR